MTSDDRNDCMTYNTKIQTSKAIILNQTNFIDECELNELEVLEEFDINADDEIFTIKQISEMKMNPFLPNKSLTSLNRVEFTSRIFYNKNITYADSSENLIENDANEYISYTKVRDLVAYLGHNEIK